MAMAIVITIGETIIGYAIAPIGHQLGYLIHYGTNIDDLRAQVRNLKNVRDVVEGLVTAAERNGDVIRPNVKEWIEEANKIVQESEHLLDPGVNGNQRCSLRSCPNMVSRYKVSRKANKKKMVVVELISNGNQLIDRVSDPAPTPTIGDMYPADAEDFESRKSIINDVMEAVKDDKYNVIGVHGMGGIGKTTLVTEVAKIAENYKLFEEITPVVAVSQTPSIMKIQHEIGSRLGMKLDEKENEPTRAVHLRDRIMKVRSILVILDDLWAELKLEDIGIPHPSVHKGCKILLTTRNEHICIQMGSQRNFPIGVLSKEEAWKLFQEKAGDGTFDSPNIRDIAIKVADECGGLPLAIVVVAGALMKIKEQSVWEDTLHRLKNPSPKSIEEMSPKLHESLKLSYDFLRSEEDKSCLLLCCLAPEDSNISVSELARWGMGLRLFNNVWKWVDVRNRLRASIYRLKTHSLLLDSTESTDTRGEYVRMHDMVRDFAISIAYESKRGIWARIDFGRSEWSDNLLPSNGNDTTIALLNNFHRLPAQIDCPKLNLLLLEDFDDTHSTVIPEMFFKGMTELRVLSMAKIQDLPCIKELKGLEILSLSRSFDIIELPREIGELTRLRILDLSECTHLERIPAGVLSRLSQLEGLYMDRYCGFNKWGEDDSASLDELKGLSNLSDLHMHLDNHNAEHFPQDIQLPMRLSEFQFHLGREYGWDYKYFPKTLVVNYYDGKGIASHQGFKMLLNMAEYLILWDVTNVECFLSDVKREGFSTLKRLHIFIDKTVEYLANYTTTKEGVMILPRKIFPVLETLKLRWMKNLKEICHGQLPAGSFCELRQLILEGLDSLEDLWVGNNANLPNLMLLQVKGCRKLKKLINICSQNIANGFGQQLHEISIQECENLEEIFTYDDDVGVEEETNEILFPKLRILKLGWTPNLATFCRKRSTCGILQQQTIFFPEKIVFSNLNELVVSGSFEEIWPPQIPGNNFCRLTDLEIDGCDKLKIAIPSNMVQRLRNNLKRLVITKCAIMKEIVAKGVHHGSSVLEFPSLEELSIENCPKLETIVARIAEGNLDDTAQVLFNDKIIFPKLQTLKVSGNFEQIKSPRVVYHMEENFRMLRVLIIDGCQKLKKAIPYNLAKSLHALEEITVKNCDLVEEVVEEVEESVHGEEILFPHMRKVEIGNCGGLRHLFSHSQAKLYFMKETLLQESAEEEDEEDKSSFLRFPQLDSLGLFRLQELTCFYHGHYTLEFPSLKKLTIEECPKMEASAFDDDVMVNSLLNEKVLLPTLDELVIIGLKCVKEIRYRQLPAKAFRQLSILKVSECDSLRNLLTPSIVKDLSCLLELEISSCSSLEAILVDEYEGEKVSDMQDKDVVFPRVVWLTLMSLPNLRSIYSGVLTLEFPDFQIRFLFGCPKLNDTRSGIQQLFQEKADMGDDGDDEDDEILMEDVDEPEVSQEDEAS